MSKKNEQLEPMSFSQIFDSTVQVAENSKGWLWMQINVGDIEEPDGKYQVQFGSFLKLKTPDGKVIVSVPLNDLLVQMIEYSRTIKRNGE